PKQERAMGNIASCESGSPFPREADKVISEMHEQSGCDNNARSVRRDEARVMNDLQNGSLIVLLKTRLVKGFAPITQRMIHINQHIAVHCVFGIDEGNATGKVFRDFGAGVTLVREFLQGKVVWFVITHRPERDHPITAIARKCLWCA